MLFAFMRTLKLVNTEAMVNDALAEGKNILAEGAQGTLLDIEFGSYPLSRAPTLQLLVPVVV